jgi:hypothetical protein
VYVNNTAAAGKKGGILHVGETFNNPGMLVVKQFKQ